MGSYRGALAGVRPDDLAAHAIGAAVERTGIPIGRRDVYLGAANQAGEDNRDAARMAALLAGPSGRDPGCHREPALRFGARGGEPGVACAAARRGRPLPGGRRRVDEPRAMGGPEARRRGPRGPQTMHDTSLGWRLVNPRMAERYSTEAMGETAENVAERYGISRSEQDRFALQSQPGRSPRASRGGSPTRSSPWRRPAPDGAAGPSGSRRTRDRAPTPRSRSSPAFGPRSATRER